MSRNLVYGGFREFKFVGIAGLGQDNAVFVLGGKGQLLTM